MVDEHATTYENPFKFSGKELDDITGLYDHGARSRDPKICGWLNIDPLCELYPDASPYVYCHGNPVRLVDPTGMGEEKPKEKKEEEKPKVKRTIITEQYPTWKDLKRMYRKFRFLMTGSQPERPRTGKSSDRGIAVPGNSKKDGNAGPASKGKPSDIVDGTDNGVDDIEKFYNPIKMLNTDPDVKFPYALPESKS